MKKALLTGANGFVGKHLGRRLHADGYSVFTPHYPQFDLREAGVVKDVIRDQPWDLVVHLAGISHVVECESNPELARTINVMGTELILNALVENKSRAHFIFASTAQVYKAPEGDEISNGVVFDESRALGPQNFYASTKALSEIAVANACERGLRATVLRLFNHTHKTQAPTFFMPHIYKQLLSGADKIPVGNLNVVRDIGSVRDLIEAFSTVARVADWKFDTFNVCSGRGKNLGRLANLLCERLGRRPEFVVDSSRLRKGEPQSLIGSHAKLTHLTGWQPQVVSEEDLVDDFLCE